MSNVREIKSKVVSIKNTQKITGAMELIATSKMRGAIFKMNNVRPYVNCVNTVINYNVSLIFTHWPVIIIIILYTCFSIL